MRSHTSTKSSVSGGTKMEKSFGVRLKEDIVRNRVLYIMVLPVLIYYILFAYLPMYGITIAFQDYDPALGYTGSPWVGLQNFKDFFKSVYFLRILKNTLHISLASIIIYRHKRNYYADSVQIYKRQHIASDETERVCSGVHNIGNMAGNRLGLDYIYSRACGSRYSAV